MMKDHSFKIPDVAPLGQPLPSLVSVVMPAFNEAPGIVKTIYVVAEVLSSCGTPWEIIVVDDGSSDGSFDLVREVAMPEGLLKGIRLSRNFGKEAAILAGLKAAGGEVVITVDADLQHPPHLIPEMIKKWQEGAKVVHAVKRECTRDQLSTRAGATLFNRLLSWLGGINMHNSSDFKLLDCTVVNVIVEKLPERQRFYRGLADWVGYASVSVPFEVGLREQGQGKWSLKGLLSLATTALVSFSSAPLRIVTYLGLLTLLFGLGLTAYTLWGWYSNNTVSGFSTIIITLLILGSFIMISLGIIGEYIAKIYEEIKGRPVYLVEKSFGLEERTYWVEKSFGLEDVRRSCPDPQLVGVNSR